MALWKLIRTENDGAIYDCNNGFIVRAKDASEARKIASERSFGDEGSACWTDSKRSSCEKLSARGKPGIILTDFHAG